jgi:hypothetical protein
MTYGTVSADAIKSSNGSTMSPASSMGFKNRIINGAMVIDQRNAGASVAGNGVYTLDRWLAQASVYNKFNVQQNAGSVTPPAGYINYLGATSSSAYSIGSGDYFYIEQSIEGLNIADLAWGTASASTVTLSFKIYSSLTGAFGGVLRNSAGNRSYPFTYTVASANTWTTISVTIAGDTSGTWLTTNGVGIRVTFGLGVGSTYSGTAGSWSGSIYISATGATSVVGTNGATFYITGVQLEAGSTATSFDYRPYGTELNLCQRYCYTLGGAFNGSPSWNQYCTGALTASTNFSGTMQIPVTMRASPSFSYSASSLSNFWVLSASAATNPTAIALNQASPTAFNITATVSGHTAGQAGIFYQNSGLATQLQLTAEL